MLALTQDADTIIDGCPFAFVRGQCSPSSGSVVAGQTATIFLQFDESLGVAKAPTLALNDGGIAKVDKVHPDFADGLLAFSYKVGKGQATSDLQIDHINLLKGAAITDLAGNAADLSKAAGADLGISVGLPAPITETQQPLNIESTHTGVSHHHGFDLIG